MEELKKENKVLKIFILILCFAVGFGVGYYVVGFYTSPNKVEEKETPKEKESDKEEEKAPTVISAIESIDDYPTESDNSVTYVGDIMTVLDADTMLTNFKDVTKTVNGSKLKFDCEEYGEVMIDAISETMGNACLKVSVSVDDSFETVASTGYGNSGCTVSHEVYKTDKYYIYVETEGCGKTSTIDIYKSNGLLVKQVGLSSSSYWQRTITNWYFNDSGYNKSIETPISFVNNNLYYIVIMGRTNANDNTDYMVNLEMRSIDLTKDSLEEKVIDSFTGYVSEK